MSRQDYPDHKHIYFYTADFGTEYFSTAEERDLAASEFADMTKKHEHCFCHAITVFCGEITHRSVLKLVPPKRIVEFNNKEDFEDYAINRALNCVLLSPYDRFGNRSVEMPNEPYDKNLFSGHEWECKDVWRSDMIFFGSNFTEMSVVFKKIAETKEDAINQREFDEGGFGRAL